MTTTSVRKPAFTLSPASRRSVLAFHIVASVGLLGTTAALVALNVRAATTSDAQLAASAYELLTMFSFVFGIPLSFASLISGIVLGLSSKWGVLRTGWVAAKLALNLSVIAVGAFVLGPAATALAEGSGGEAVPIAAGAYDVAALCLATGLSVFKPRRRRRPSPSRRAARRRAAGDRAERTRPPDSGPTARPAAGRRASAGRTA